MDRNQKLLILYCEGCLALVGHEGFCSISIKIPLKANLMCGEGHT